MGLGKTYSTDYLVDSNGNTGVAGQILVTTATGVSWQDAENTGDNQTQGSLFDSKIVLIDTPNGGLKTYRVITDEYGEWIQVGRFAANAMTTIQGTWSSVSGLSTGIAQSETTQFSADFGDSFPTEVRVVGATDFNNWRNTRTIDWVYKVPEGRKWKYFFSNGAENGMSPKVPLVGGASTRHGWTVNGAYDGFGRWSNPDLVNIGMSDADVTNPSAAYSTATANAFNWDAASDAKLTVNAYTTYSGQDQGTTSAVGSDDANNVFYDTYPTQTNNGTGGTEFSSAVWVLIKLPGGASGSGGGYWAANGLDIYNTNADNVGIGTDTPNAKLEVEKTVDNAFYSIFAKNPSSGTSAFVSKKWLNDDAGFGEIWRNSSTRSSAGQGALSFNMYNSADINFWSGGSHTMALVGDNATFAGNVVIGSVDSVVTGLNIGEASPTIQLFDTTNDGKLLMYMQDSSAVMGTYSNHALNLFTDSTLAVGIDVSQNATFAGDITTNGSLNINRLAGATPYDNFKITTADIVTTLERVENTADAVNGYGRLDFKTNAGINGVGGRGGFKFINGSGDDILYLENNDSSATFGGKATSVATAASDGSTTLTTKSYVDGLVTGVPVYKGTWAAGTTGVTSAAINSTTITLTAAPTELIAVGDVVTADGIITATTVTAVASQTSVTVSATVDIAITTTVTFSPEGGFPDLTLAAAKVLGNYYIVSTAGSAAPNGSGVEPDSWAVGDWCIFSDVTPGAGTDLWQRIDNSSVISGAGTGGTIPLWEGATNAVSETLGNAPITVSGNNTTFVGKIGIGASPTYDLDIANNNGRFRILGSTGYAAIELQNSANGFYVARNGTVVDSFATGNTAYAGILAVQGDYNLELATNGVVRQTIDGSGNSTFAGNVRIGAALLSNQENTDIDSAAAEVVAQVAISYTAAFFDFVVKKGTNVRSGTVYACHDATNVEFTETSTNDLGDTSDVTLSVDKTSTDLRLIATVTSDGWSVKSLIRAI
jgi:hypothetical protein